MQLSSLRCRVAAISWRLGQEHLAFVFFFFAALFAFSSCFFFLSSFASCFAAAFPAAPPFFFAMLSLNYNAVPYIRDQISNPAVRAYTKIFSQYSIYSSSALMRQGLDSLGNTFIDSHLPVGRTTRKGPKLTNVTGSNNYPGQGATAVDCIPSYLKLCPSSLVPATCLSSSRPLSWT